MSSNTFDKEEFLRLVKLITEQQYNSDLSEEIQKDNWIEERVETIKGKMKQKENNGILDLSNAKRAQIINQLHNYRNLKIGNFFIKISKYRGDVDKQIKLDIYIYEEQRKLNSKYGNLTNKIDPLKDSRFSTASWIQYFDQFKLGNNVPMDKIPDIVRWLQAIQKLTCFA